MKLIRVDGIRIIGNHNSTSKKHICKLKRTCLLKVSTCGFANTTVLGQIKQIFAVNV